MSYTITREEPLIRINSGDSSISQNLTEKMDKTEEKNSIEITSKQFDVFLIESIDEALSLLGVTVKNEFYLRLQVNFNMDKNDIPQRLEEFMSILHRIFNLGASRLEVKFLRNLDLKIPFGSRCILADWSVSMWIEKDMSFIKEVNNKRQEFVKPSKA
jgi:hypothetical protein